MVRTGRALAAPSRCKEARHFAPLFIYRPSCRGLPRLTNAPGCSTIFRERERFTKHRLRVIGADGVDLKPMIGARLSHATLLVPRGAEEVADYPGGVGIARANGMINEEIPKTDLKTSLLHQLCDAQIQRRCQPRECQYCDVVIASFDPSNVATVYLR